MTGAKPRLAGIRSFQFSSTRGGETEGKGADLAKLHAVISSIISRSIAVSDVQIRGCLSIWGSGILRGGQCHLLLCFSSPGISAVHMEICWDGWMGAIAVTLHATLQSHKNENTHTGFIPVYRFPLTVRCWRIYKVKQINAAAAGFTCVHETSPPNSPTEPLLSGKGHNRRMINVPPLTPHCELKTTGRNYFSWRAGSRLWRKNGANTVYHRPDDSPPRGKLTTRPYRLARAGSRCPFTLINLPVFPFQLYQSNLSEDTQHWSVSTAYYCTQNTHTHNIEEESSPKKTAALSAEKNRCPNLRNKTEATWRMEEL